MRMSSLAPMLRLSVMSALVAGMLGAALLTSSPAIAAKSKPDLPDVRALATIEVKGAWVGHIVFGTLTTGRARTVQSLPLDLHLARTSCDMTGCITTQIVVDPSANVLTSSRISGQLSGASLSKATYAVTVRRIVNDIAVAEHSATMVVQVRAQRRGPVVKRTTLTQTPGREVLSVTRMASVRATVLIGEESLSGTGEISRSRIVGK